MPRSSAIAATAIIDAVFPDWTEPITSPRRSRDAGHASVSWIPDAKDPALNDIARIISDDANTRV